MFLKKGSRSLNICCAAASSAGLPAVPVPVLCVSRGLQQRDQQVHRGVRALRHLCDAGIHSSRRLPEHAGPGREPEASASAHLHFGFSKSHLKKSPVVVLFQKKVSMYPFQIHSIFLSSFASLIGPFGGFFASGFKRAFKIKVICYSLYGTLSGLWLDSLHLSSPLGLCQHYPRPRWHHGSLRLPVPDGHLHPRLHRQLHPVGGGPEAGGGRGAGVSVSREAGLFPPRSDVPAVAFAGDPTPASCCSSCCCCSLKSSSASSARCSIT